MAIFSILEESHLEKHPHVIDSLHSRHLDGEKRMHEHLEEKDEGNPVRFGSGVAISQEGRRHKVREYAGAFVLVSQQGRGRMRRSP